MPPGHHRGGIPSPGRKHTWNEATPLSLSCWFYEPHSRTVNRRLAKSRTEKAAWMTRKLQMSRKKKTFLACPRNWAWSLRHSASSLFPLAVVVFHRKQNYNQDPRRSEALFSSTLSSWQVDFSPAVRRVGGGGRATASGLKTTKPPCKTTSSQGFHTLSICRYNQCVHWIFTVACQCSLPVSTFYDSFDLCSVINTLWSFPLNDVV